MDFKFIDGDRIEIIDNGVTRKYGTWILACCFVLRILTVSITNNQFCVSD
jgi:hypothetical protein